MIADDEEPAPAPASSGGSGDLENDDDLDIRCAHSPTRPLAPRSRFIFSFAGRF